MTLTSILPTLRASIPDPINSSLWPDHTITTVTDVLVDGLSMTHLIELSGTPAVYPSRTPGRGVVMMRVVEARTTGPRRRTICVDFDAERVQLIWSEARLIGRVSTARVEATDIGPKGRKCALTAPRPADILPGDVLAAPCEMPLQLWLPDRPAGLAAEVFSPTA